MDVVNAHVPTFVSRQCWGAIGLDDSDDDSGAMVQDALNTKPLARAPRGGNDGV